MFLTRDQIVAHDACRELGFNPSDSIVLTIHSKRWNGSILSVLATKDGKRYNLRFLVKKALYELISVDLLLTNFKHETDNINTCVQDITSRIPQLLT